MTVQRRDFLCQLLGVGSAGAAIMAGGCGTILYHERVDQPHSRDIDWKVAAMNGLGLALFFVPGVVAFVVDFYTGAIYLPPAGTHGYPVAKAAEDAVETNEATSEPWVAWQRLPVPRDGLRQAKIEQALHEHLGEPVSLSESKARISTLSGWDEYHHQVRQHFRDGQYGATVQTFFAEMDPRDQGIGWHARGAA